MKPHAKVKSGITHDEIIQWGGQEVFNQALALCNSGDVSDVKYDDDTLVISGKILQPSGYQMPVSLKLKPNGRIDSKCPCPTNQRFGKVCAHVVAIGIAQMVMEMDEPEARPRADAQEPSAPPPEPEPEFIEVPMKPRIFATLAGSRASLSIVVDVKYGNLRFHACSLQPPRAVWLEDEDDPLVRRTRSIGYERTALKRLLKWGFEPGYKDGDPRHYITDPQKVLNFLGAGIPELRRAGWRFDLSDALMAMTEAMPSIVPVVTVKDAPGGAFDIHYTFDARGKAVSPADVQAALNRGDG